MFTKKTSTFLWISLFFTGFAGLTSANSNQATEAAQAEYRQDFDRIQAMGQSLNPQPDREAFRKNPDGYINQLMASRDKNDLNAYEKFADAILNKWASKNAEYFGRLTLALCADLSGGTFNDDRCYELRRKYALSALEKKNALATETELELTGCATTSTIGPYAAKGEDFVQRRKEDMEVRLHAWQRLIAAIDPAWVPDESGGWYPDPPEGVRTWASGMDPNGIEDPVLRAEYKALLEEHSRMRKKDLEQRRLKDWVAQYPKRIEPYIIYLYSTPPYNMEELEKTLDAFALDEVTTLRIRNTVTKNIKAQTPSHGEGSSQ